MPAIQLRVDAVLSEKIKAEAVRHNISANKWLIDAIRMRLETEEERKWRAGFEAMGNDPDCNDLEYAWDAQREVILAD